MGLEGGTYISDLVDTNPLANDAVSTADDHIRLIKSTIKTTFPSVTGAVTSTHTELNLLDGVTVIGDVTTTATQTLTNKTLENVILDGGYYEEVYAASGTTPALSPNNGSIQTWTLSGNSTPTAGTWAAGQSMTLMIDDGTAYTVTWTSVAVTWVGGSAPTLGTSGYSVIELWKVGTTIYGAFIGYVA